MNTNQNIKASKTTYEILQRTKKKLWNRTKILFKSIWLFMKSTMLILYCLGVLIIFNIIYVIEKKSEDKKKKQ